MAFVFKRKLAIVRCDSIGRCGSCRRTSRGPRVLKNRGRGLAGVSHEIFLSRPRFLMARWTIRDRAVKDFYLVNFINCTMFRLIPLISNFLLFPFFVFLPSIFSLLIRRCDLDAILVEFRRILRFSIVWRSGVDLSFPCGCALYEG